MPDDEDKLLAAGLGKAGALDGRLEGVVGGSLPPTSTISPDSGNAPEMMDDITSLARLVLVGVMWSEWEPDRHSDHYHEITGAFLDAPAAPDQVRVHQCHRTQGDDSVWIVQSAPYELPLKDRCNDPGKWLTRDEWIAQPGPIPVAEVPSAIPGDADPAARNPSAGKPFRTRIICTSM